jgi:hypothetical protein
MRNKNIEDIYEAYDYSPNELAKLAYENPSEYRTVVQSNLEHGDTVENWERRNMEVAKRYLAQQKLF